MELSIQLLRFAIITIGIGFAVILGSFRPEWKSRKTLISWAWTMVAVDIIIMDPSFARSISAQLFLGGALILNVINFIGDRIETIKFKDFSASLGQEVEYDKKHSIQKKTTKKEEVIEQWPDDGTITDDPGPVSEPFTNPKRKK